VIVPALAGCLSGIESRIRNSLKAPLAQLDRASGYEPTYFKSVSYLDFLRFCMMVMGTKVP